MAQDLVATLRSVSLFTGLSDSALAALAQVCRVVHLAKGAVLLSQADFTETVYVVRRGRIDMMLLPDTPDGRELVIGQMRTGECFGELAILTGRPRSASAVAHDTSELIAMPGSEFLALLDAEPKVMRRMIEIMAQRLQFSSEREGALAFLDAHARLARVLLQLDHQESASGYMTISQDELAQHTGLTRQTVAKALGQWRRSGWLLTGRGRIVLLDRVALRRQSDQADGVGLARK